MNMNLRYSFLGLLIMAMLSGTGGAWASDDWQQYQMLRRDLFFPAAQNFESITCKLKSALYDGYARQIEGELYRTFGPGNYFFDSGANRLKVTYAASSERIWFEVPVATVRPDGLLSSENLYSLRNELQEAVATGQDLLSHIFKDLRIPKKENYINLTVTPLGNKVMVSYQDAADGEEIREYYHPDYHITIQPMPPRKLIWDFDYTRTMRDGSGQNKRVLTMQKHGEMNPLGDVVRLYTSKTVIEYAYISGILFPVHFAVILDEILQEYWFEDCTVRRR